jgi:serine/threonine protein kinase
MPRKTRHQKRRVSRKQNLPKKRHSTLHKKKGSQNRTKRGGRKYGQGAKGALYDIYLKEPKNEQDKEDTLFEIIGNKPSNIILYKYNNEKTIKEVYHTIEKCKESPSKDEAQGQEQKKTEIDKTEYVSEKIEFDEFSKWLQSQENTTRLAKVFTEKNAFLDELKENSNVFYNTLNGKGQAEEISALEPNYILNEFEFSGVEIELQDTTKKYVLFTKKCIQYPYYILTDEPITDKNKTIIKDEKTYYNVNMKQFMIDILTAIHKVNTDKFYHNDIKLSNMVYDPDNKKMKLIDWGAGKTIPEDYDRGGLYQSIFRGDPIFSSLYKMYIRYTTECDGVSKIAANANIYSVGTILCTVCNVPSLALKKDGLKKEDLSYYRVLTNLNSKIPPSQSFARHSIEKFLDYQSDNFQKQIKIIPEVKQYENDTIKKYFFDKYRQSFDLHMFGMTIFHAVYIFDLNSEWIDKYAIPFTNLDPKFTGNYLTDTMTKIKNCIEELPTFDNNNKGQKVSQVGYWNGWDSDKKESIFSKTPRLDKINPLNFFKSKQ